MKCLIVSQNARKMHHSEAENWKIFWEGGTTPSPDPSLIGEEDIPSPKPTLLGAHTATPRLSACGASIFGPPSSKNLAPPLIVPIHSLNLPALTLLRIYADSSESGDECVFVDRLISVYIPIFAGTSIHGFNLNKNWRSVCLYYRLDGREGVAASTAVVE